MTKPIIQISNDGNTRSFAADRLIVAGWVGKDAKALQSHIKELQELGVAPPGRTPTYMSLSPQLLTTGNEIQVIAPTSSGEVEAVIFAHADGELFVGVGSDHTDRDFEKYSIPASKQMCGKVVAPEVWPMVEVSDHLDEIILRSWIIRDGRETLYQEGKLATNRSLQSLQHGIPADCLRSGESYCMFCGTFAALGGLCCSDMFSFAMEDPVLKRTIRHSYRVQVLRQFL
jgi:hypothetical protein